MPDGQCGYELFFKIADDPTPLTPLDLPESSTKECCISLIALADLTSNDIYKNDEKGFIFMLSDAFNNAILKLQKFENNDWQDLVILTDDTYGKNYEYGFFINSDGESYIGYLLKWKNVLTLHSEGKYKIICEANLSYGSTVIYDGLEFCLFQYTPARADGSVRLEWYLNNFIGDNNDFKKRRDFANLNWYDSIRIPAFFGSEKSEYERENIRYTNGQEQWVRDEQQITYRLTSRMLPASIHDLIKVDALQSDELFITDYNRNNVKIYKRLGIRCNSNYEPEWNVNKTKQAPVIIEFSPSYNNFKRSRC